MKIKNLLPALGIMLVLSGCTPISPGNADPSTAAEAQSGTAASTSTDNSGEAVDLSDSELMEFTTLFNTAEYNGFLVNGFNSPEDIDWDAVISNGAGVATRNAGVSEINDYLDATGKKELDSESVLYVIKNSVLAKYIQKHTGTEISPKPEDLSWDYLDKYDSYYFYTSYLLKNNFDCTCTSGEKSGDTYTLRFAYNAGTDDSGEATTQNNYGFYADRILTLTKSGDDIVVRSNEIQWDDHSNPKLTKDVELPQFDTPIHVVTYNEEPYNACMAIVKDGKSLVKYEEINEINLLWQTTFMDEPMEYTEVLDYDFFDFNADGLKDLAVIQNSDYGKYLRLFSASPDEDDFYIFSETDEKILMATTSDFSMNSIKAALLNNSDEASTKDSYQKAYLQIAHIYKVLFDPLYLGYSISDKDTLKYDLINIDTDKIPELVISSLGFVSLYTYKDNIPICLIQREKTGWFDPAGSYSQLYYAPEKGIYYSYDSDYHVFNIKYTKVQDNSYIIAKNLSYTDIDKDDRASSDEEFKTAAGFENAEYINETGKQMTDDEIKSLVNLYNSYEKKELKGTMDYDALIDKLK